ncbi:MAG: hydrolase [Agromyces sp.]|jgi:2-keto-4-pentenoate hydratase/2-oxohepta-3-ene-1,7-dioic acid hydratase in catechol pathway|nr:hydrolase [Agromyces sp.]
MTPDSSAAAPPPPFALGTFVSGGEEFPGMVVDDQVVDIRPILPGVRRTGDLFAEWDANVDALQAETGRVGIPLESLRVLPPVQPVGPILAAGVNYREHIVEMSVAHRLGEAGASDEQLRADAAAELDRRVRSGDPYIWTGIPSAVSGAYDDVRLPDFGEHVDWEAELGVVIGRPAWRVSVEEALDHVAGYVIVNDITARSLVPRDDIAKIGTDWFRAKNQPTFFPVGPLLVPARFVPDPSALRIQLRLNGTMMQDSSTYDMAFDVSALIAYASSVAELRPGDLLITGSPAGNGSHWKRFLEAGDVMEVSITGLGTQRTAVRGPSGVPAPWHASRAVGATG